MLILLLFSQMWLDLLSINSIFCFYINKRSILRHLTFMEYYNVGNFTHTCARIHS